LGNFELAKGDYENALKLKPGDAELTSQYEQLSKIGGFLEAGKAAFAAGVMPKAIEELAKCVGFS